MSDPRLFLRPRRPIPARPHLLLSNDDGVDAPGLAALARALAPLAELTIVAPRHEQSGMSHALSIFKDLRLERWAPKTPWMEENADPASENGGPASGSGDPAAGNGAPPQNAPLGDWWALEGTPADCVKVGLVEMRHRRPIDMVVAGVNRGINAGVDVHYSGTVAAAREGTLLGLPSMAVSLFYRDDGARPYPTAARVAADVFRMVQRRGLPPGVFLNVNVPPVPYEALRGWAVARMGNSGYQDHYVTMAGDSEGELSGKDADAPGARFPALPGTRQNVGKGRLPTTLDGLDGNPGPGGDPGDADAAEPDDLVVERDMVAITPLLVDLTARGFMRELRGWLRP